MRGIPGPWPPAMSGIPWPMAPSYAWYPWPVAPSYAGYPMSRGPLPPSYAGYPMAPTVVCTSVLGAVGMHSYTRNAAMRAGARPSAVVGCEWGCKHNGCMRALKQESFITHYSLHKAAKR